MRDYILFIDTETSGIPKRMDEPTCNIDKWPYILQIAWIICSKNGDVIKRESHYINAGNIKIKKKSKKIHGITKKFLRKNGEERQQVIELFCADIAQYNPLMVGHFIEFDTQMLAVAYNRVGIKNECLNQPKFCTMRATRKYLSPFSHRKYLRLEELYLILFGYKFEKPHDALADAEANRECFFKMIEKGDISDAIIEKQQNEQKFNPIKVFIIIILILALFVAAIILTKTK